MIIKTAKEKINFKKLRSDNVYLPRGGKKPSTNTCGDYT